MDGWMNVQFYSSAEKMSYLDSKYYALLSFFFKDMESSDPK